MTLDIFLLCGFFEVYWGFFLCSNESSILCFYKSAVKQISCQSTMENKDDGVKSYSLITAAMQYVGGGSMSPPQCKERLQSGGKSQPPWNRKTSGCTLRFLVPPLESTCDLVSVELLLVAMPSCAYSLQSPSGAGGLVLSSSLEDRNCWGKSLLVAFLVTHYLLIQLSGHTWFSMVFLFGKGKGWRTSHTFQIPRSVCHPGKFSWVFGWFPFFFFHL